ncbi:hypothetical protein ACROYT_G039231 [Oculina patagonica]
MRAVVCETTKDTCRDFTEVIMELNSTTVLENVSKNNDCDNNNASALRGNSSALHCQDFALKPMEIFLSVVLYSIIAIVGSLGNTLVLLLIKRTTNLKTTFGVLIANLAIADLLVTAVAVPLVTPTLIRGFVPTCSSNASVIALIIVGRYSCTASVLLLAAMSRYGSMLGDLLSPSTQNQNDFFKTESGFAVHLARLFNTAHS